MLFHQTSPTSYFDREVQSKPRIVLAWPFPLASLGGVGKRSKGCWARTFSNGRERVAAALWIASTAACSSKASRADARKNETSCQLISFLHHLWRRNDFSMCHLFAVDLHSLAENSCRWRNAQPPCPLVQCVGNFVAGDGHGTPPCHLVLQNRFTRHFLDGGDPLFDSTLLPRRIGCYGAPLSP